MAGLREPNEVARSSEPVVTTDRATDIWMFAGLAGMAAMCGFALISCGTATSPGAAPTTQSMEMSTSSMASTTTIGVASLDEETSTTPSPSTAPSTTTTLADGPPDPTGATTAGGPLHLVVTSDQILDLANYDPQLQSAVFRVETNAIVRFVMTPPADWRTEAGSNIEVPQSDNAAVLTPIKDRGACPTDSVCATFVAAYPGTAHVGAEGISGCGTSGCVDPLSYEAAIVAAG